MNATGLRVLSRKIATKRTPSRSTTIRCSSRFDENDALMYFDDVKVPWDRVFVHRDTDMCRAQFHDTPGHVYPELPGADPAFGEARFPRSASRTGHRGDRHHEHAAGARAARHARRPGRHGGGDACGHGGVGLASSANGIVPNRHFMYAAQVMTQDLYPRRDHTDPRSGRRRADHAALLVRDFGNPELAAIINKTQRSAAMAPEDKVKFLKAAWDAIGSEFGSRHTQYEMFYAGARFVTCGHSFRTFDWENASGLVDRLLSSYDLRANSATQSIDAEAAAVKSRDRQPRTDRFRRLAKPVRRRRYRSLPMAIA